MPKTSLNSIYNILAKIISGQASEIEKGKFDAWLISSQRARELFDDIQHIWPKRFFTEKEDDLASQKEIGETIWQKTFGEETLK